MRRSERIPHACERNAYTFKTNKLSFVFSFSKEIFSFIPTSSNPNFTDRKKRKKNTKKMSKVFIPLCCAIAYAYSERKTAEKEKERSTHKNDGM